MQYKGMQLDDFQEEAINAIEANKSVVVSAPTGSGKTLIADYIINRDVKNNVRVIYTAPIKALSNQKYKDFCKDYSEQNVGLLTGDVVKNPAALILIMTTEIYRNMVISQDPIVKGVSYVIFDEIHYINDIERGYVWEESIIFSHENTRLLFLSATIPNADEFARWVSAIKGHEVEVIRHDERPVPLQVSYFDSELGITKLAEIRDAIETPSYEEYTRGPKRYSHSKRYQAPRPPSHIDLISEIKDKLPCLFFNFSRIACQRNAVQLASRNLFEHSQQTISAFRKKLLSAPKELSELESTKMLKQTISQGIAFHHAGLLPVVKDAIEELFSSGLIKVLYTTETFAVGINMPAKSVCFESLRKFDGTNFRLMNSKEFFQIAGRAGRRGIDTQGFVFIMVRRNEMEYEKTKKLTAADKIPLTSQFKLSVNTVLNLVKRHNKQEIEIILSKNFHAFQKNPSGFRTARSERGHIAYENTVRRLERLGYIKNGILTAKGEFASKIYVDEILLGEIFTSNFYLGLDTSQLVLLVACICYEPRERTQFYKVYRSKQVHALAMKIKSHSFLNKHKRFQLLTDLTALVHPSFHGHNIFDIVKNTNLLEGDIIRFFRQIIDRLSQIRVATQDSSLIRQIDDGIDVLLTSIKQVDVI